MEDYYSSIGASLAEVVALLDVSALVAHRDDLSWDIFFDEDRLVEAYLDEEAEKLVLTTELGTPAEADAARLYPLLLQYNDLWRETSGLRMALDGPGGAVIMIYDVSLAKLDVILLRNILENYDATAKAWKALIASSENAAPKESSGINPQDSFFDPAHFIRV